MKTLAALLMLFMVSCGSGGNSPNPVVGQMQYDSSDDAYENGYAKSVWDDPWMVQEANKVASCLGDYTGQLYPMVIISYDFPSGAGVSRGNYSAIDLNCDTLYFYPGHEHDVSEFHHVMAHELLQTAEDKDLRCSN